MDQFGAAYETVTSTVFAASSSVPGTNSVPGQYVDRRNGPAREALVAQIAQQMLTTGLTVTLGQVRRLCGTRSEITERILEELVRQGNLWSCGEGTYTTGGLRA